MLSPKVIFLNGTSSAGKSSLAAALQEALLPEVWLAFSIDTLFYCLPPSLLERGNLHNDWSGFDAHQLAASSHSCLRTLVERGHRIIFDRVVTGPGAARDLLKNLEGLDPILVGVDCSLEEIRRRAGGRKDRTVEEAESHFGNVHLHFDYDILVDTTRLTPALAAGKVISQMHSTNEASGWKRSMEKHGLS